MKKHKSKAVIIVGSIILLLVVSFSAGWFGGAQNMSIPKVVETEIAHKQVIYHSEKFIGTIKPKNFCNVIAKASGTIDIKSVAGNTMKKGEIIARIDNPDIERTYDLCVSAEQIAHSQYNRLKTLEKSGASSKGNIEDKEQAWIAAQKSMAAAKIEFDNINIKAPFDGTLGIYKVKNGEDIAIGEQIVSFYNNDILIIDFDIPEEFIDFIKDGQSVFVNGKKHTISHVQMAIDEESHMCPAYIEIPKSDVENWIIGSSIDIDIVIKESDKKNIVLSGDSVFIKDGKTYVYAIKDGAAILKEVGIGIRQRDNKIEIINGDVKAGDEIVSAGQERLYDGIKVILASSLAQSQQQSAK